MRNLKMKVKIVTINILNSLVPHANLPFEDEDVQGILEQMFKMGVTPRVRIVELKLIEEPKEN